MNEKRIYFLDSARGFAMILMAIYHFCFDLNLFDLIHQNFNYNYFWISFRSVIMSLFMGAAGVSMYLAQPSFHSNKQARRLRKIGIGAIIISFGTFLINPEFWIYFGALHLLFIATLASPFLIRFPKPMLILGIILIALPNVFQSEFFDRPIWILSGFSPMKPNTEDFAPIAPWLGVIAVGIYLGFDLKQKNYPFLKKGNPTLAWLGQNSLMFYLIHQAILYPLAWVIAQTFGTTISVP